MRSWSRGQQFYSTESSFFDPLWRDLFFDFDETSPIELEAIGTDEHSRLLLTAVNLDIDHCLPWTVWPCGDLWNLMPAHRKVNQHEKRDRLPADPLLRTAQDRILDWWNAAYRENPDHPLAQRFALEASASLPGVGAADADLDSYYSALNLQRLRLKQNQQVPEWSGTPYL